MSDAAEEVVSGRRVVATVVFVVTCTVLPVFMVGALGFPIRQAFDFGESRLGLSVAIFFLVSAFVSSLVGPLVERLGASVSLRLACLCSATGLGGIAVIAQSWAGLTAWLCVASAGMAIGTPAANLALAERVAVHRMGFAFGVKQASAPAGTLLAGLAVPTLAVTLGWRAAALAGAALALLVMASIPELEASMADNLPRSQRRPAVKMRSTKRILIVLGVAFALGNVAANSVGVFLVESAVASGVDIGVAGLLLALGSLCGMAARVAAGWMADRREGGHFRAIGLMLIGGGAAYGLLGLGVPWLIVPGAILGFAAGWGWNGLFSLAVVVENPNAPALATGLTHTGGYLGAGAGPLIFGAVAEYHGYGPAWRLTAAAALIAAGAMFAGQRLVGQQEHAA